jgi:hypothetical protein
MDRHTGEVQKAAHGEGNFKVMPWAGDQGRSPTIQLLLNGVHPVCDFILKGLHMCQQVKLPLVLGTQQPLSASVKQSPSRGFLRQDLFGDIVPHLGMQ